MYIFVSFLKSELHKLSLIVNQLYYLKIHFQKILIDNVIYS